MIAIFNKFKTGVSPIYVLLAVLAGIFTSCEKGELDIQDDFPFEVRVMPVPQEVANGQSVEIRMTIVRHER